MSQLTRNAPAKINLSFRILRKREDGFHEIESLMAPISLADRLTVRRVDEPGIQLVCSDPTLPTGEENLVVKAARAFFAALGNEPGILIELEKFVPHGAGLGGGSSDAATVLLLLNQLSENPFTTERLSQIAASFGSDIPFFIYESAALCRGRGETVEPQSFPHAVRLLLIKPPFGVPTPWAYSRWKDSKELPGVDYSPQPMPWGDLVNDLERPVFEKHILLGEMKMWLREQPEVQAALMSGSGSTMFAVLRPGAGVTRLENRVKERYGSGMFVREAFI